MPKKEMNKADEIDKLLDCNCDVCGFKQYDPDDCYIRRKKAIKSALLELLEERIPKEKDDSKDHRTESWHRQGGYNQALDDVLAVLRKEMGR